MEWVNAYVNNETLVLLRRDEAGNLVRHTQRAEYSAFYKVDELGDWEPKLRASRTVREVRDEPGGFLRVVFAQSKTLTAKVRNDLARVLGKSTTDHLLVLTSDYTTVEFVLLDNFYVESEVSADGHEWTLGAVATDFVEKTWPLNYGHNARGKFPYPSEGRFPVAMPSAKRTR